MGAILTTPEQKSITEQIDFQLPFLRIITETETVIHISIGDKTSATKINKLLIWINNHMQEYNIVLLTNIDLSPSQKSKKTDEQKQIAKLIQTSSSSQILTVFQKILHVQKKQLEIVAYVIP